VRRLIAQYNTIVGRRHRWGGGHAIVGDRAFDCSGAVGFGLIKTGLLDTEVAGLRPDTSPYAGPSGATGVRWGPPIGAREGFHMRHPVGL